MLASVSSLKQFVTPSVLVPMIISQMVHPVHKVCYSCTFRKSFFEPFPKQQILDSSKLKECADENFEFYQNSRKVSEMMENTGKRRNCSLRAISPLPTVFSKDLYSRHLKPGLFWEKVNWPWSGVKGKDHIS